MIFMRSCGFSGFAAVNSTVEGKMVSLNAEENAKT